MNVQNTTTPKREHLILKVGDDPAAPLVELRIRGDVHPSTAAGLLEDQLSGVFRADEGARTVREIAEDVDGLPGWIRDVVEISYQD